MSSQRAGDCGPITYFRTERLYRNGLKWYFLTREGTEEGPFDDRVHAAVRLRGYINAMSSGLIAPDSALELSPR